MKKLATINGGSSVSIEELDSIGEQKAKNLSILSEMSDLTLEVKSV